MATRVPPLQALRAFEAAARFRSFTRAAEHLGLTHGAISHQIKALETQIRTKLFRRDRGEMVLTETGQTLVLRVRQGLRMLESAFEPPSPKPTSQKLTISVLPSFATRWLVPRLHRFETQNPNLRLLIQSTQELATFDHDGVDLAIRYGPGGWPGLHEIKLMDEMVYPVCSPSYRGGKLPLTPGEMKIAVLLNNPRQPWGPWFYAAGVHPIEPENGASFTDASLLLAAAEQGQGIALARSSLVSNSLRAGQLIRLFDTEVPDIYSYYLVWRPADKNRTNRKRFCDWILQEAAIDE